MSSLCNPSPSSPSLPQNLPLREIPGNYGFPFFGPLKDRWDFFYFQGRDNFFRSRIENHNSTVFRTNMVPGPWISHDPRVVVLLDAKSFPVLFDMSKVEKNDVLTGTYTPSTSFTGGYRVCAYLDPSESNHNSFKGLLLSLLASKQEEIIPLFQTCLNEFFLEMEDQLKNNSRVDCEPLIDKISFEFVYKLFCDGNSPSDFLMSDGAKMFKKWLICQIGPVKTLGLPVFLNPIEDLLLHSVRLPFFLVKNDYEKIYNAFYSSKSSFIEKAQKNGISREEACHNLVFMAGFNAFGGFITWFPSLIKWVASAGETLHHQLADEIRTVVKSEGGVTLNAIHKMTLTKSVVYEAFRIEPPIPYQYGRAKENLMIQSHDYSFKVNKGEMLFGYQPFATKDPKIFDEPEKFKGNRFVGEEGEKLLKYVLWCNGRVIDDPTVENKQCPGKNLVELMSTVFLVELFLRYDSFSIDANNSNNCVCLSLKKGESLEYDV
ncbi:allene oxide synthase 1, chloroplastic-like isoform X1 [Amaranthus tricolor]|uniref:allene oxide synthase 1, chloroplastic-like isoform X1 n=1 Tax=Amaranthus tricolor TaxID=29722 RepID=UPI00258EF19F|nr:allene oxide synthase 1, chloroplastic-like isoform X1 [Amaranthus tricolor]